MHSIDPGGNEGKAELNEARSGSIMQTDQSESFTHTSSSVSSSRSHPDPDPGADLTPYSTGGTGHPPLLSAPSPAQPSPTARQFNALDVEDKLRRFRRFSSRGLLALLLSQSGT